MSHGEHVPESHAHTLDLDADVVGHLDDLTAWLAARIPAAPSAILDIGAGSGTGTRSLASRFPSATVTAMDASRGMLDHLVARAEVEGIADRIRAVAVDAEQEWSGLGPFDLIWASSSLHHMTVPDAVLRSAFAASKPGANLVVVEMDGMPYFLPESNATDGGGLEGRLRSAMIARGWNAYPDWTSAIEAAGFSLEETRTFSYRRDPAPSGTRRYAERVFESVRGTLAAGLDDADRALIEMLLNEDSPLSIARRSDLVVRSERTVWLARRGDAA